MGKERLTGHTQPGVSGHAESAGDWVGQALGTWRARELRSARAIPEFRGLSREQLEDLYQESATALLHRAFKNEAHLRSVLRLDMRHRALNLRRDERRRREILHDSAPGLYEAAMRKASNEAPENATILREDRLTVAEFLAELKPEELRLFWHELEGLRYRAIAPLLGIEENEARRIARAIERKRERFQTLYDSGRLCGFRASTIEALQREERTSEELFERAVAHLARCTRCREDHQTNAARLRASFQQHANALLPLPAVAFGMRLRMFFYRALPSGLPGGADSLRDGAVGILAGAGLGAKVAGGLAAAVVAAGSGLAASGALEHSSARHHTHLQLHRRQIADRDGQIARPEQSEPPMHSGAQQAGTAVGAKQKTRRSGQTDFDYLGVVSRETQTPGDAQSARVATSDASTRVKAPSKQGGGGEFSP